LERLIYPAIGSIPVEAISRDMAVRTLAPHWVAGRGFTAVVRTQKLCAQILDFSVQRSLRPEGNNPFAWKAALEHHLPAPAQLRPVRPMAAMPYKEVPEFYRSLGSTSVELALRWTILLAVRSQETLKAQWSEIDTNKSLWTVPAPRTKKRRELVIPLPPLALELLDALPREQHNPYLFIGNVKGAPLTATTMITWLRRQQVPFHTHGFRSSFRSWAAENTAFPPDVLESALGHLVGDQTERAYNRSQLIERRRPLMVLWADFLLGAAADEVKVVPFKAAGA
jgi:integrase